MSKVVVAKGKISKAEPKSASVSEKRVRDAVTGEVIVLRTLEGRSKTFGRDLSYVFGKNIAKARRENKQVTGVADRVPAKG